MVIACWSVKGGVGTTVVVAAAAVVASRARSDAVLLVDLAGDLPACLGIEEPVGPGIADWLAAGPAAPPDALARLTVPVGPGLHLVPRGAGRLVPDRAAVLLQLLSAGGRTVLVDCGRAAVGSVAARFAAEADRSLLVTRACVLAGRRAERAPVRPSGVVVVRDPGRALTSGAVGALVGAPVAAELAVDPSVGRAVDAGLLRGRLPRPFAEAVASLVHGEVRS